jgi:proteasome accessory factor B
MQLLERLVNLVALLLDARLPLTFDDIRDRMAEAYEQDETDSAKRMFERDKDILRDIGVPIEVVTTDAWETQVGYVIAKDRYYLPEIRFAPEEISALFVAAHSGREDRAAEDAVRKLLYGSDGGILAGVAGIPLAPEGETSEGRLIAAAEAVAGRRSVRFSYRTARGEASDRQVDAYGLVVRGGHWYLVGLDRDRDEARFRLSRSHGPRGRGRSDPRRFRAADHVQAGPWGAASRRSAPLSPDVAWWAVNGIREPRRRSPGGGWWTSCLRPRREARLMVPRSGPAGDGARSSARGRSTAGSTLRA